MISSQTGEKRFKRGFGRMGWPDLPLGEQAQVAALIDQLLAADALRPDQLETKLWWQAVQTLSFARQHTSFYRDRVRSGPINLDNVRDIWAALPVLSVDDVVGGQAGFRVANMPADHPSVRAFQLLASTGASANFGVSHAAELLSKANLARLFDWYGWDLSGKIGHLDLSPDKDAPDISSLEDWALPFVSGPATLLQTGMDGQGLVEWLRDASPDYLLGFSRGSAGLLAEAMAGIGNAVQLKEVLLLSDRAIAQSDGGMAYTLHRGIWLRGQGAAAATCPEVGQYHLLSGAVLGEIVDSKGRPAEPGEVGRFVVSALHNLCAPLLRLDSGIKAALSTGCECGRLLPVIKLVL